MTNINRRTVLKGAIWSVPVIAAAVATPLAAASEVPPTNPPTKSRLDFNAKDAWDNNIQGATTTVGAVVGAKTLDGTPVSGVLISARASWSGETKTFPTQITQGWGSTPEFRMEFAGAPKGVQVEIFFTVSAPGCETISFTKKLKTGKK